MSVAVRLKQARKHLRLTQNELAKRSNVTQATISRIEKGAVTRVRSLTIQRLAEGLSVSTDYLEGRSEDEMTLEARFKTDKRFRNIVESYTSLSDEKRASLATFTEYLFDLENPVSEVIFSLDVLNESSEQPAHPERKPTARETEQGKGLLRWFGKRRSIESTEDNDQPDDDCCK